MSTATNDSGVQNTAVITPSYSVSRMDAGYQDLERLRARARIPMMSGTAGDVLNRLQERIGRLPLDIQAVAESLDLSQRTLQRRLKSQMVTYVALRDRVRFHHAIDCLLVDGMGVEEASKYLDFSDRTSFTNAFKRWAKMSPNTFKKLYRDYV